MIEMSIESIRVSLMNYQRVVMLKEKMAERYLPIWIGPAEADAIAVKLQGVTVQRPLTHDLLGSFIDNLGVDVNSVIVDDLKNDTFYAKIVIDVGQLISSVKFENRRREGIEEEWIVIEWGKRYSLLVISRLEESNKRYVEAQCADKRATFMLSNVDGTSEWQIDKIYVASRPSDALALAVRAEVPIYAEEVVLDKAGILLDKETGKPVPPEREESETGGKKVNEEELKKMSAFYDFINTLDLEDFNKHTS